MKLTLIITAVSLGLLFAAASNQTMANVNSPANHHPDKPHWSYSDKTGPDYWANLADEFALCGSGKRQSPLNLKSESAKAAHLYSLTFNYHNIGLNVLNNGHTLQANYHSASDIDNLVIGDKSITYHGKASYNSFLMIGDEKYQLLQFHFHTPSEHQANGGKFAMELHLVHKNDNGNLAVVGILLKQGAHNATLQKVLTNAPGEINKQNTVREININASDLLPKQRAVYHYSGSLTTPPCSENVNWYVMAEPIQVSARQVTQFRRVIGENARPVQPMNWRSLYFSF